MLQTNKIINGKILNKEQCKKLLGPRAAILKADMFCIGNEEKTEILSAEVRPKKINQSIVCLMRECRNKTLLK